MGETSKETPPVAPAPAPAPAPVAPPSEVDRVLRGENVDALALKKVISERAKVTDATKKMSHSALEQLSATFERELGEHDAELAVDGSKAELIKLRDEVQAAAVAKAPNVNDVEKVDPTKAKTWADSFKSFASSIGLAGIGGAVLGWVKSIRNTMIDWGMVSGKKEDLDKAEDKFKAFFGAAEVRDVANGALQGTDIEVHKGSKDMAAYLKIQGKYNVALAAKLLEVGGKDPAGKPNEIPAAMQEQIKSQFPFRAFFEQEVKAYAAKYPAAELGKKRVTTLSGIANSEKPVVTPS